MTEGNISGSISTKKSGRAGIEDRTHDPRSSNLLQGTTSSVRFLAQTFPAISKLINNPIDWLVVFYEKGNSQACDV